MSILRLTAALAAMLLCGGALAAQEATAPEAPAGPAAAPAVSAPVGEAETVRLLFPDQVELKLILDYVAAKLKIKILYDERIAGKKVTLRAAEAVPVSSLMDILQAAMAYKGLVLKRTAEGWYQLEDLAEGSRQAPLLADPKDRDAAASFEVATVVVRPKFLPPARALATMRPYLSATLGKDAAVSDDGSLVIVTDYLANLRKAQGVLDLLDTPPPVVPTETRILEVRTMAVAQFQTLLQQHLRQQLAAAVPPPVITADATANSLLITADTGTQEAIRRMAELLDRAPAGAVATEAPIGGLVFYTLYNIDAAEAAATLAQLFGGGSLVTVDEAAKAATGRATAPAVKPEGGAAASPEGQPTVVVPVPYPPAPGDTAEADVNRINVRQPTPETVNPRILPGTQAEAQAGKLVTVATARGPQVTVYPATNSLIIEATQEEHQRIARILERLDKRRPQVLLEAVVVEIVADDSWSLGIELEDARITTGFDPTSHLVFSAFGLSTIDLNTGRRTLLPGGGLNAVILSPNETEVVLQAVATSARSRVLSSPSLLVNDNATASIESIREEPYTSLNASQTVSTTSFAGYAQAGTQMLITPHIAQGPHLRLQYNLTLNNFTGAAPSPTSPPPRTTNTVSSEVMVPDGYTVVVGGLVNTTDSDTVTKVPILGDIPLVGLLFQSKTVVNNRRTIYIFLRPVIFRDQAFQDLKLYSGPGRKEAGIGDEFPDNPPMIWRMGQNAQDGPAAPAEVAP